MYLKSLVLKGFKSFADRSVLSLEPGVTAIVGPNGSGKSNISDAVLWVLGERSARNLRGQAMEDVIFAGSSARKATGLAEVELILDNSDGTLPIDYDEVAITRRIYRSGESEYLINGTVARRMDVLDILHDTGLGTGTHSIISQGSLDSILRSSPEERRALIEEAAGVLKHKQRMEKSARKMDKMSQHVARVRDVVGEVERQLGPLARKAKRAQTYAEISGELAEAKLALAVDDLRKLQTKWDALREEESVLNEAVQARRTEVDAAESAIEELTEKVRVGSEDAGELSRKYQAASNVRERLDSTAMLVRDRRRAALSRAAEIDAETETNAGKRANVSAELQRAQTQLQEARSERDSAVEKVKELEISSRDARDAREKLEASSEQAIRDARELAEQLEEARVKQAQAKETVANSLANAKVIEGQQSDLELAVGRAEADAKQLEAEAQAAEESLVALDEQERAARELLGTCAQAREACNRALAEAQATEHSLTAQIQALEEVERASEMSAGDAHAWVFERRAELPGALSPLSHDMKAAPGLEGLVELLLGSDVMALLADDASSIEAIAQDLKNADEAGEVSFVMRKDAHVKSEIPVKMLPSGSPAKPLIEGLTISPSAERAVRALLGDVAVCETLSEALSCHANDSVGLRFVTKTGAIVWPTGKVSVGAHVAEADQGVLARVRHLDELRKGLVLARETTAQAQKKAEDAEISLSEAQSESMKLSQQLAVLRGSAESARTEADKAVEKHSRLVQELSEVVRRREAADVALREAQPSIDAYGDKIEDLSRRLEEARASSRDAEAALEPLREKAETLDAQLAEARLAAATLEERVIYATRVAERHMADLNSLADADAESAELAAIKRASAERLEGVLAILEDLARSAQSHAIDLEEKSREAQTSSAGLHSQIAAARESAQAAHRAFDEANERLNSNRVEVARLEVQVQTAVSSIIEDCETPMEEALELPQLENREEVEDTAFRLSRRIANLGTINPDAAEEYAELKERYDYLAAQLDDLDSAARALGRINRAIESRMKDDFANTFEEVNKNFQDIFATLFPGGSGHLSFDDPEDMENTGVEVNAQPAGKRITKMMLMSGGEKSLTALALLFAVYRTRTTPFYILDEVEAALDDTNLRRLVAYIDKLRNNTQLIMITHQRRTMEMADVLFGVSMQADGVTKVISQRLDRALEYAE